MAIEHSRKAPGAPGTHGWDGGRVPRPGDPARWGKTFSVGIFEWTQKSSRKGTKRGPVKVRLTGDVTAAAAVFSAADDLCAQMDAGFVPGFRSRRIVQSKDAGR